MLKFQFHMVRLKDVLRRDERGGRQEFQFHMVRLKDIGPGVQTGTSLDFNSTWYD